MNLLSPFFFIWVVGSGALFVMRFSRIIIKSIQCELVAGTLLSSSVSGLVWASSKTQQFQSWAKKS